MSKQQVINVRHNIRKTIFNAVKRMPRILDVVAVMITIMFNVAIIYALDLTDSELLPPYFLTIVFVCLFTGRRVDPEKVTKDLLREGDSIGFIMGGDQVQFGFVDAFVPTEQFQRLGLRPDKEYITITDISGELRILPVSNIGILN